MPSLAKRKIKLKLCQLYNILHSHSYFPKMIYLITITLDLTVRFFVNPYTPIHFYTHLYLTLLIFFVEQFVCRASIFSLITSIYFIYVSSFHTCHTFWVCFILAFCYYISLAYCKKYYTQKKCLEILL